MSITIESNPTNTQHTINNKADRLKFLRRLLREDGWTMHATASNDWQMTFRRTVKSKLAFDVEMVVRLEDKISIIGKYGKQQSFHDSKEVIVPKPDRAWLSYGAVRTAARFLLEGYHFMISGSSGSTSSSEYGLAFVSLQAMHPDGRDTVEVGHQSVYVHGRMVCCGSVE